MKRYDLFISYSAKDREFVSQLAGDLQARGLEVWFDVWEMKPGDRLRDRINDGIARCDYLLIVISPNSIASPWVKLELDSAMIRELENQQIVVIPTLLGRISTADIPIDLKGKHYLDFRAKKDYAANVERIEKLCEASLDENQKTLRRVCKREAEFMFEPWRILWPSDQKPELFAYKAPNRFDGVCRIERVDLADGRVVIMCEDIDGNPGNSITNCIEYLAAQVCDQYEIDPEHLTLITHHDTWYSSDNEWDLVTFAKTPPQHIFQEPSWETMTKDDWRSLGFRPRKRGLKDRPSSGVIWYSRR